MVDIVTESWLWYGIVMTVVVLRYISRILHFKSFFRFQIEDYLMLFVACAYTVFIVLENICMNTNTNLIDPSDIPNLTPDDIAERTYGSKIIIAVEQTMCIVQWGSKACLLFLYYRLTENLVQNIFVKVVGAYVATTYVVMEVLYLGYWCRPFSDYWKTPTDNVQCTTALHHLIVNLSFNLSSDILIMSIPLPLLLRARLEIKRKILLCFPFTLGFFSIICAILSKYVSFTHPFSPVWAFWYTREASCVMIVANMPYTWGLIRRTFKLKSFWGRGSDEADSGDIREDETHDTGMEIVAGEVREIRGIEPIPEENITSTEKNTVSSTWRRVSNLFESEKSSSRPGPEILVESKNVSEKTSPTSTQSNESAADDNWKDISWNKGGSEVEISRVATSQSMPSPDSLMPPSAAVVGTGTSVGAKRTVNSSSRRASAMDIRRMSTYTSKHTRLSVSEASRRSTRNSANVDAVDRLYPLDDEHLVADLEAARPRSHHSHRNGFG